METKENNYIPSESELAESKDLLDFSIYLKKLIVDEDEEGKNQVEDIIDSYAYYWAENIRRGRTLPPLFIKNPYIVEENELAYMGQKHIEYYKPVVKDFVDSYDTWDTLVINSGMYGGKTTLAVLTIRELEKQKDIKTSVLIAEEMNEDRIDARALGEKGIIEAKRFGIGKYSTQEEVDTFVESLSDLVVLDEYTFSNPEGVLMLMRACKSQGKKLILLGLDNNAFGEDLEILGNMEYLELMKDENVRKYMCKSFISPNDKEPLGTSQIRYLFIPKLNKWVLDIGIGRLVISKEEPFAWYSPSESRLSEIMFEVETFHRSLAVIMADLAIEERYRESIQERIYRYLCGRMYSNER